MVETAADIRRYEEHASVAGAGKLEDVFVQCCMRLFGLPACIEPMCMKIQGSKERESEKQCTPTPILVRSIEYHLGMKVAHS